MQSRNDASTRPKHKGDEAITEQDVAEEKSSLWSDPRIYIPFRFFASIRGFHTGSLDLTGRHLPRYEALMSRWNRFLSDLLDISTHAIPYEYEDPDGPEGPQTIIDYRFMNATTWQQFQERWRLPSLFNYSSLLSRAQTVLSVIAKNPTPKIQKICLTDGLPTEILQIIMGYATLDQARLLSATSKYMRQLGLRYIFGSRTICLEAEIDWDVLEFQSVEGRRKYLHNEARKAKIGFLNVTDFLLSRPDLTQCLRSLTVRDHWTRDALHYRLSSESDTHYIQGYYTPIHRNLNRLLLSTSNLTTVFWHGMDILPEFLRNLINIKTLHTLTLMSCMLDPDVCESIVADQVLPSETLLNLQLFMSSDESMNTLSLWHMLIIFPRLRTLTVTGFGPSIPIPSDIIRQHCNPFTTLERIFLHNFDLQDIPLLSGWILEASEVTPGASLKLTHFKMHSRWGMTDLEIFEILDALQLSPCMQILALEGLRDCDLSLIDHIAHTCPNLTALTLIRRHNDRQSETKLAPWPHASWEYAPHFAAFTQLRHFGWNIDITCLDSTPSIMKFFEEGFPNINSVEGWRQIKEQEFYFKDDYLMAGPFAAHCPTLCTFAVVKRSVREAYSIQRTPDEGIRLKREECNSVTRNLNTLNPYFTDNGWPLIMPVDTETARIDG